MKRILAVAALALASVASFAQTTQKEFLERYSTISGRLGVDGVGIETLLTKWEAAFPDDTNMMAAAFLYYYTKSQTNGTVSSSQSTYLGQKPILELKDSLDNPVYYFYDTTFDDEMFGKAQQYIDKCNQISPDKLENRCAAITALLNYEKASPDMALSKIRELVAYNYASKPAWTYEDEAIDQDFFKSSVQEYCYAFYKLGTPSGYEAFRALSELMLQHNPSDVIFLDNIGSYYNVAKNDSKNAYKYYNKALKVDPKDLTAIKNCIVMARKDKSTKLEKKYLPMMVNAAEDESTRLSAQARLDYLNGKR